MNRAAAFPASPAGKTGPGTDAPPVLDVRDLTVGLTLGSAKVHVLQGVTFKVGAGEIMGMVGESGSGKSLTALAVMRMLPRAAEVLSGDVRFADVDLLNLPEEDIVRLRGDRIGVIFQDPMAFLNPLMTVGQQIEEVLCIHGMDHRVARKRAVELLVLVGVRNASQRVNDYPHQFSGGMRQRVMIAIAVANSPTLLLADEPTTALDVTVQAGILDLLRRLRDELGMALVLITHDIGIVEQVCDTVMVMYAGRVVEYGKVADVLGDPRQPYTRELMKSTPKLDLPVQQRLNSIPGQPPDVLHRPAGCPFHPRCPVSIDRCQSEMPPLTDHGLPGLRHEAACWRADELGPISVLRTSGPRDRPAALTTPNLVLDVRDARVTYAQPNLLRRKQQTVPVVDGVSLKVFAGRSLGLVGESGCGKSTLARTIVGLLPLAGGSISIDGKQWQGADRADRLALRRTVQMVFQDPYTSLNPRQTIRGIVTEPLAVHKIGPSASWQKRVEELFTLVGLPRSLLDRHPYQLSGGQRQRVGIARALAMEPKLIVADEPVSALDVSVQAQIINLLADLRDELKLGLLIIAHDLTVVRHLCEDVAVMQAGQIVEQAPSNVLFSAPQHPYTLSLLAAAPGSPWKQSDSSGETATSSPDTEENALSEGEGRT